MVAFRLSYQERCALRRVAKRWGVSQSEAVRLLIEGADGGHVTIQDPTTSTPPSGIRPAALPPPGGYLEPVFCGHANENPYVCDCPSNCYCKAHTCKNR